MGDARWSTVLEGMPQALAECLDASALAEGEPRWSKSDVAALTRASGMNIEGLLQGLLPLAAALAEPPISNYRVGAVALGHSGALYLGCNLEFVGHALQLTVHAEQAAATFAWHCGETGLQALALTAAPCGHCRQFLYEMEGAADLNVLWNGGRASLSELLPQAFGPSDLGMRGGWMARAPVHELSLDEATVDGLTGLALDAARRSYAPYSRSYAGVAIEMADGRRFAGAYVENAAFNPSLSPLHGALVHAHLAGCSMTGVGRCVVVQVRDARVDHIASTRRLIASITAPSGGVIPEVFHAKR